MFNLTLCLFYVYLPLHLCKNELSNSKGSFASFAMQEYYFRSTMESSITTADDKEEATMTTGTIIISITIRICSTIGR
jgi:hypothetical protein